MGACRRMRECRSVAPSRAAAGCARGAHQILAVLGYGLEGIPGRRRKLVQEARTALCRGARAAPSRVRPAHERACGVRARVRGSTHRLRPRSCAPLAAPSLPSRRRCGIARERARAMSDLVCVCVCVCVRVRVRVCVCAHCLSLSLSFSLSLSVFLSLSLCLSLSLSLCLSLSLFRAVRGRFAFARLFKLASRSRDVFVVSCLRAFRARTRSAATWAENVSETHRPFPPSPVPLANQRGATAPSLFRSYTLSSPSLSPPSPSISFFFSSFSSSSSSSPLLVLLLAYRPHPTLSSLLFLLPPFLILF